MKKTNILSAAVLMALLASCHGGKEEPAMAPMKVRTEVAGHAAAGEGRVYVGEVEAASSTAVSFTGTGTVVRVLVDEGQPGAAHRRDGCHPGAECPGRV